MRGRHAGDLLGKGTVDEGGNLLLLTETDSSSWAAGVVHKVYTI